MDRSDVVSGLKFSGTLACFVTALAVLALALVVCMQRRVIYPLAYGEKVEPLAPAGFSARRVPSGPGSLLVWHAKGRPDRPTLLFLHGNATDVDGVEWITRAFRKAGWSVVAPEYPGYPGNDGSPSERGLDRAAEAGWKVATEAGHTGSSVVVMGNSIGSGPAIGVAARHDPLGLVVVSGMASMPQVVRGRIPLIPDFLVWDRYYNAARIAQVSCRTMIVHGREDDLIPLSQGLALARTARTHAIVLPGGHGIMGDRRVVDMVIDAFADRSTPTGEEQR